MITPEQMDDFILKLPLNKIPGVGKVTFARLQEMGLETCADVRGTDVISLVRNLGKFGQSLWERSMVLMSD